MEIHFQRTYDDYSETIQIQLKKSLRSKMATASVFFFVCILGTIVLMSFGITQGRAMLLALAGMIVLRIVYSLAYPFWLKRDFRHHPNFSRPMKMRVRDTGLYSESEAWAGETSWNAYVKYGESENLCLLYLGARSLDVIPKRAFSVEQLEEFRRLVGEKVPDRLKTLEQRSVLVENRS